MTTITATAFKTNFKHFSNMASKGERLLIKRPQKESNLVVLNEDEYKEMDRLLSYYKGLVELSETTTTVAIKKREIIGLAKGKIFYPDDFDEMNDDIANIFYTDEDSIL